MERASHLCLFGTVAGTVGETVFKYEAGDYEDGRGRAIL